MLILMSQIKDFIGPKPPFGLDDETLPLSAMAALTIHASSGIYFKYSDLKCTHDNI
jgi:hypothetical protein